MGSSGGVVGIDDQKACVLIGGQHSPVVSYDDCSTSSDGQSQLLNLVLVAEIMHALLMC